MMALGRNNFGSQIIKHFHLEKDSRTGGGARIWQGIQLVEEGLHG
jgi:hypothetical protein